MIDDDEEGSQVFYHSINKLASLKELSCSFNTANNQKKVLVRRADGSMIELSNPENEINSTNDIEGILLSVPKSKDNVIIEKDPESGYFYFSATFSHLGNLLKGKPIQNIKKISVFYDVSTSRRTSDWKHELKFLQQFFENTCERNKSPIIAETVIFSNTIHDKRSFQDLSKMIDFLSGQHFDGGTNIPFTEICSPSQDSQMVFLFTDGIVNYGKEVEKQLTTRFEKPIFCVSSSQKTSYLLLRYLSNQSGGTHLDLSEISIELAIEKVGLERNSVKKVVVEPVDAVDEVYTSEIINDSVSVFGRILEPEKEPSIYLQFGEELNTEKIGLKTSYYPTESDSTLLRSLWTTQRIQRLSIFPTRNRKKIIEIGMKYKVVTEHTSLIVLSELSQYKKYKIMPPKQLKDFRKEYINQIEQEEVEEEVKKKTKIDEVVKKWESRILWHKRDFTESSQSAPIEKKRNTFVSNNNNNNDDDDDDFRRPSTGLSCRNTTLPASDVSLVNLERSMINEQQVELQNLNNEMDEVCGMMKEMRDLVDSQQEQIDAIEDNVCASTQYVEAGRRNIMFGRVQERETRERSDSMFTNVDAFGIRDPETEELGDGREEVPMTGRISSRVDLISKPTINVKAFQPNAEYLKKIGEANDPYLEYLHQKKSFEDSPSFYLDCADYFLTKKNDPNSSEIGIRVLSNIVELGLNNIQLFRIIGYRLFQSKKYDEAVDTFERVLKENPSEPQSYRDLALVLEKIGGVEEKKRAVELMYKVIYGNWDQRFDEIELTAATELKHILLSFDEEKREEVVKSVGIDERLLYNMDCDIRISMAWDTDMTDIDLHVYDPNNEHCYYSNKQTSSGGFISRDFTRGYGPEEFLQKKVQKTGKFRVTAKYFASHQQGLTGGTTILCTFFTNYLRPNEKSELITLRLNENKEEVEVCEIVFNVDS